MNSAIFHLKIIGENGVEILEIHLSNQCLGFWHHNWSASDLKTSTSTPEVCSVNWVDFLKVASTAGIPVCSAKPPHCLLTLLLEMFPDG